MMQVGGAYYVAMASQYPLLLVLGTFPTPKCMKEESDVVLF